VAGHEEAGGHGLGGLGGVGGLWWGEGGRGGEGRVVGEVLVAEVGEG
jgi:hypothetical protein